MEVRDPWGCDDSDEVPFRTQRSVSDGQYEAVDEASSGGVNRKRHLSRGSVDQRLGRLKGASSHGKPRDEGRQESGRVNGDPLVASAVAQARYAANGKHIKGTANAAASGESSSSVDFTPSTKSNGELGGVEGTGHPDIPPIFVVNAQLPDIAPPLSAQGDGPTIHVILNFRATQRLCRYAARLWADDPRSKGTEVGGTTTARRGPEAKIAGAGTGEASGRSPSVSRNGESLDGGDAGGRAFNKGDFPAGNGSEEGEEDALPESVPLLAEWMRRAPDDGNFRGRFKAIGDVINVNEVCGPTRPNVPRKFAHVAYKVVEAKNCTS